jgi:NADH-quinone oxidoreductase subunit J
MGEQIAFYALAFVLVAASIMAVTVRNIFHAAIYLIVALFSVAGFFILLHAEFLAAVQVLIYVGAVAVLMIFAVMLTTRLTDVRVRTQNEQVGIGAIVSAAIFVTVAVTLRSTVWPISDLPTATDNVRALGRLIMTRFVLPFEIVSVLLLAAMIGAIVIAVKEEKKGEES